MGKKAKKTTTIKTVVKRGKLPNTKGRFYEDPRLVRSERDPNFKKT